MTTFLILHAIENADAWDALFNRLPPELRDVHFSSGYARVQEGNGGHAVLAVCQNGGGFLMQPFVVSPVGTSDWSDLSSLYGYGGPIGTDASLRAAFQGELSNWARSEYIAAEFCCLHPLYAALQTELIGTVVQTYAAHKQVVVMDLEGLSLDKMRRRVKRGVKAARESGAIVMERSTPGNFGELYDAAMKRKEADGHWHFSEKYWQAHFAGDIGARFFFLLTTAGSQRALLTIGKGETAYAHFLGSNGENRHQGFDELLYYEAAVALQAHGYKRFHLGGGLSNAADNPLLAFKSGFSDKRLTAQRYGRIFEANAYDMLCDVTAMKELEYHGRESKAQWFPQYRRPFQ